MDLTPGPSEADAAAPAPRPADRYCTRCGRELGADEPACPCPIAAQPVASADRRRPLRSSLGLYFSLLAVSLVVAIVVLSGGPEERSSWMVNAEIAASIAFSAIVLVWSSICRREVWPALHTVPSWRWFALAALLSGATWLCASLVVSLLASMGMERIDYVEPFRRVGYGPGLIVLLVCAQPAIFEELAFRGVILSGLARALTGREAVIVSACMFMILHLSVPSAPHLLIIGLVLGWLRMRTGSLLPGMALHFCHNFLVILSEGLFHQ